MVIVSSYGVKGIAVICYVKGKGYVVPTLGYVEEESGLVGDE